VLDAEDILNGIVRGALGGGRRKSWRRAERAWRGGGLLDARTLIAAAGVAWGLYETWQQQQAPAGRPTASPAPPPEGAPSAAPHGGPPLAAAEPPTPPAAPDEDGVPAPLARLLRIMISAASADGELGPAERERILAEAREVGAETLVRKELDAPRPLGELVAGVSDPELKRQIYALAFVIVRADETVGGGERIYLAQLASRLGLDQATVARLEGEAARGIDAG
jgi:uncharacterized membrane protein YebE (DUF533 family)